MPILSTELISNYYTILLNKDGALRRYILESWNENLQQDVTEKSFIQGDIGSRIVEFSNPFHQATMSGPILILKDLDSELTFANDSDQTKRNQPTGLYDIFDLILDNLSMIIRPLNSDGSDYFSPDLLPFFLDSATISINNSEVNTTATVTSIYPNGFSSNNFNEVVDLATFEGSFFFMRTSGDFLRGGKRPGNSIENICLTCNKLFCARCNHYLG